MSAPLSDLTGYLPLPPLEMAAAVVEAPEWAEGGLPPEEDDDGAVDHFDRLPDSVLLLVFNRIGDVKALGRCSAVSRRFHALVPLVDDVLVRVDCVISDYDQTSPPPPADDSSSSSDVASPRSADKPHGLFSHLARLVLAGIVRPLQAIGQILASPPAASSGDSSSSSSSPSPSAVCHYKRSPAAAASSSDTPPTADVSHYSPTEVLRNFREIRRLRIELPAGELDVDDGVLLKWKADFGSTLNSCVILGASSVLSFSAAAEAPSTLQATDKSANASNAAAGGGELEEHHGFCGLDGAEGSGADDNGSTPESFYTSGSLKLRVVWTISSLIAASARHYLLQPIIADHGTLESLELTDADGQGVLQMDRGQLEELRVKPVSASGFSQRTLVPALNMRLWHAQHLELLSGGVVLKGATLVAIRPSEEVREKTSEAAAAWTVGGGGGGRGVGQQDTSWVCGALEEEPYRSAVRQLVKRRMHCLEMNSF